MATEIRERQARYAERQRDKGRHRVCFWLQPAVLAELRRRIDDHGGDKQDAANAVFQELLAQTKPVPRVVKVVVTKSEPQSPPPVATVKIETKAPPPTPAPAAPVMISTVEAAKRLQITVPELNRMHRERRGPQPRYVKRRWLYDERELDEWLGEERRKADEDTAE